MFGWTNDTPYQHYDAATIVAELKLANDTRPGHTGSYWDNGFTIDMYLQRGQHSTLWMVA